MQERPARHESTIRGYRPDIDGLRAVAVLAVVLFHAGSALRGGFVGVDVFFVISGFLITASILGEQDAGTFRLRDFFARRIRRIVPAVAVMTLATLLLGGLWLSPAAWIELARSAIAQAAMVANHWYRSTTHYFDGDADLKPLLHTWSLAVEEQFYLVYPLCLVAMRRLSRPWKSTVLVGATLASLLVSDRMLGRAPMAVYYLLPTRAWELLLGGVVTLLPRVKAHRLRDEAEAIVGLALIVGACVLFDRATPFPGRNALVPCLGCALVIHANAIRPTLVGHLLSFPPLVGLGVISYSLYLWHWPILALVRNLVGARLPLPWAIGSVGLAVVVAAASWRWVEEPVRRGRFFRSPGVAARLFVAGIATTAVVAGIILLGRGFPGRFSTAVLGSFEAGDDRGSFRHEVGLQAASNGDFPVFGVDGGERTIVIWGDSHAMMMVAGLDAACRAGGIRGLQATHSGTPPLTGLAIPGRHGLGAPFNEAVLRSIRDGDVDLVILAGYWSNYARLEGFEDALRRTLEALVEDGVRVAIVLDTATFPRDVPQALATTTIFGGDVRGFVLPDDVYQSRNRKVNRRIRRVADGLAIVIDPRGVLTDDRGDWESQRNGLPLYWDYHHLSVEGSLLLEPLFENLLRDLGIGDFSGSVPGS